MELRLAINNYLGCSLNIKIPFILKIPGVIQIRAVVGKAFGIIFSTAAGMCRVYCNVVMN